MNEYIKSQPVEVRKAAYIQRMWDGKMSWDIVVNNEVVWTAFDAGEAKQFCIDHKLSTRMVN